MRIGFEFAAAALSIHDEVAFGILWSMADTPICVRERVCTRFSLSVRSWMMRFWSVCTSLVFHPFHFDLYRLRRSSSRLVVEFALALVLAFEWVYNSILRVCDSFDLVESFGSCTRTSSGDAVMR